jgi:hypothetical protein
MLRRHGDELQPEERAAIERALREPDVMAAWCDKINEIPGEPAEPEYILYGAKGEFADKLWSWFKENWPTILKLLLSLLVML